MSRVQISWREAQGPVGIFPLLRSEAPPTVPSSLTDRARALGRRLVPVFKSRHLWAGLLALLGLLVGLFFVMNYVVMPLYTRHGVAVTVPEVRELPFEQAVSVVEDRGLRAEPRNQPFNPNLPRGAVVDQNPQPNAAVKPGRRIYLYVNSGPEQTLTVPDVRTATEINARARLAEAGFTRIDVREDTARSENAGVVTRQAPEPGRTVSANAEVTVWVSPGLGEERVEVPDVRGLSPEGAAEVLRDAGLWVDPTRGIDGVVTRQEPGPGEEAREGTEVRLYSEAFEQEAEEDSFFEDEGVEDDGEE